MDTVNYIAYGSNLHPIRLGRRCRCELAATGVVRGRRLVFHKRGRDTSGKCDAPVADDPVAHVWVAVYRIPVGQMTKLDAFESYPHGYRREELDVETAAGVVRGVAYIAQPDQIEPDLPPFDWYRALVAVGAAYQGFPREYVAGIEAVEAMPDPQVDRAAEHWRIVEEMRKM